MKSAFSWLAALLLVTALFSAVSEEAAAEQAADPAGVWYGEVFGFQVRLNLEEGGAYTLSPTGIPEGNTAGTWTLSEGEVLLDGDETQPLLFTDDTLSGIDADPVFTRVQPQLYTPGAVTEAVLPDGGSALPGFEGVWESAYVLTEGAAVPASAVGEYTLLYLERFRCALAGSLFGEMTAQFAFTDGMLTLEENGLSLRLQLQEDGFLRMTVSAAGEALVLILRPVEKADFPPKRETPQE